MKDMGAVGCVLRTKGIVLICFDDVQPGLVFMHRVQDDLGIEIHYNNISSFLNSNHSSDMTGLLLKGVKGCKRNPTLDKTPPITILYI